MKRNALAGLRQIAASAAEDHEWTEQDLRAITTRVTRYRANPTRGNHTSIAQAVVDVTHKPPRRTSGVPYSRFRDLS